VRLKEETEKLIPIQAGTTRIVHDVEPLKTADVGRKLPRRFSMFPYLEESLGIIFIVLRRYLFAGWHRTQMKWPDRASCATDFLGL
jgi:hypothetical protein